MKQTNNSQPVTKSDLKKEFKAFEVHFEKRMEKKFVTKDDLKWTLKELKQEVDENARKYRDQILTKLDEVMGELATMRDENTIGTHQISELRSQVDNHEKRITNLEQTRPTT